MLSNQPVFFVIVAGVRDTVNPLIDGDLLEPPSMYVDRRQVTAHPVQYSPRESPAFSMSRRLTQWIANAFVEERQLVRVAQTIQPHESRNSCWYADGDMWMWLLIVTVRSLLHERSAVFSREFSWRDGDFTAVAKCN